MLTQFKYKTAKQDTEICQISFVLIHPIYNKVPHEQPKRQEHRSELAHHHGKKERKKKEP